MEGGCNYVSIKKKCICRVTRRVRKRLYHPLQYVSLPRLLLILLECTYMLHKLMLHSMVFSSVHLARWSNHAVYHERDIFRVVTVLRFSQQCSVY